MTATLLAQAAGEPMSWWQALLTTAVIFGLSLVMVVVLFGRR
ncbi:hypothetical protein ACFVH4_18965 [Nocardia ignorata]